MTMDPIDRLRDFAETDGARFKIAKRIGDHEAAQEILRREHILKAMTVDHNAFGWDDKMTVIRLKDGRQFVVKRLEPLDGKMLKLAPDIIHCDFGRERIEREILLSEDDVAEVVYVERYRAFIGYEGVTKSIPVRPGKVETWKPLSQLLSELGQPAAR
jgi:hypothetical protein